MTKQKITGRHLSVTIGLYLFMMIVTGVYANIASTIFSAVAADESVGITIGSLSSVSIPRNLVLFLMTPIMAKLLQSNARLAMIVGGLFITVPYFFQSYFDSILPFYISGAILGIGGAVVNWSCMPMMINRWWAERVGMLIGLAIALNSIGKAIFTPVVAKLIVDYGWRATYQILGIFGAACSILIPLLLIKNKPSDYNLLPVGESLDNAAEDDLHVKTTVSGLDARRALKTPSFYLTFIMAVMVTFIMCFQQHEIYYAMTMGFSIVQGAAIISAGGIANYFTNLLTGIICDKWGIRVGRYFGGVLFAISLILFFIVPSMPSYPLLLLAGIFFGAGFSVAAVIPVQTQQMFGTRDYAQCNAYVSMGQALGGALGGTIYGLLYDASQSYHVSLLVCACFIVVMLVCGELAQILAKPLKKEFTEAQL